MLNKNTLVEVTNISSGSVGYDLPELHVSRRFNKGEVKKISVAELRALSYISGGLRLITDFLSVDNEELLVELGVNPEPEYFWDRAKVEEVLSNGTLAELQDALDFGPDGIKELIKQVAVETRLNDMSKREAIFKATGFNVNNAIQIAIIASEDEDTEEKPAPKRRVEAPAPGGTVRRRIATPEASK